VLPKTLKRIVAASTTAMVLTGTAVGLANAQGTPMTPTPGMSQPAGGHHHHGRNTDRAVAFGIAAQAIGVTPQELRTELPGMSLAQVAQAHGKNPADIGTALKNAANQRIDEQVTAGKATADQAAQRKQTVDQRIDQALTTTVPQRGSGQRMQVTPTATPAT
jgi:hypothetical protein